MKRSTHLASAALAAVLVGGASGPSVAADQQSVVRDNGTVHVAAKSKSNASAKAPLKNRAKSTSKKQGEDRRASKSRAQDKSSRAADKQAQQALRAVAQVDKLLSKAVAQVRTAKLDGEDRTTLLANINGDRALLAEAASTLKDSAGSADAAAAQAWVKELRPQNYSQVINQYRAISRLLGDIDELWVETEEGSAEEAALDEAEVAVYQAADLADLVTARSTVADLQAITSQLSAAQAAVDAVAAALAAGASDDGAADTEE